MALSEQDEIEYLTLLEFEESQREKLFPKYTVDLFNQQTAFMRDPAKLKAALCSRRAGKSRMLADILLHTACRWPGEIIPYIATTRGHAKRIMWKELKKRAQANGLTYAENNTELTLTLSNDATIMLGGAQDESDAEIYRGNRYPLFCVDECASFRAHFKSTLEEIIEPAFWGTTVVALRTLSRGESFVLGDGVASDLPIPDGIDMSPTPLKGGQGGWELDTRGCVGGLLTLRGRGEDPVAIARAGAPVPVMPGDYGLIQYGQFAIFFQYTAQPIAMTSLRGPELLTMLAIFCSAILHLGMLGLVRTLMTPDQLAKPLELTNPEEYAARFGLKRAVVETPRDDAPIAVGQEKGGGSGVKDPGAQDKKAQGGGKKIKGDEGKFGMNDKADHTQLPGEIKPTTHYGGLSEVLEGDTGKEIQNTLKSINTVSAALSGLNSNTVVLGSGGGTGLKGAGSGGGGTGKSVTDALRLPTF